MTPANLEAFFAAITGALGADGVNRSEETIRRYGENTMPGGDRPPAGVVYRGIGIGDHPRVFRLVLRRRCAASSRFAQRRVAQSRWRRPACRPIQQLHRVHDRRLSKMPDLHHAAQIAGGDDVRIDASDMRGFPLT